MEELNINLVFPEELLYQVFLLLPPKDLKSAVLVCKWWAEVGQSPGLWSWVCPVVEKSNIETVVTKILPSKRFQSVKRIELKVVSEELFKALIGHLGVRFIDVDGSLDSSYITTDSLVKLISKVTKAKLCSTLISRGLQTELFQTIKCSTSLKKLILWDIDLSRVEPDLFGQAITQIKEVDLRSTDLTPRQGTAIFANLGQEESKAKLGRLWVGSNNLSCIDDHLMARGVNRLEVADITGTWMKNHQVTSILNQSLVGTNLRFLRLAILVADSFADFATRTNPQLIDLAKRVIKTVVVSFQFEETL